MSIVGLNVFKEYFKDYAEQYVLIGGAACDIIFEEQGTAFRATKDLDMVLIVEALSPEFGADSGSLCGMEAMSIEPGVPGRRSFIALINQKRRVSLI